MAHLMLDLWLDQPVLYHTDCGRCAALLAPKPLSQQLMQLQPPRLQQWWPAMLSSSSSSSSSSSAGSCQKLLPVCLGINRHMTAEGCKALQAAGVDDYLKLVVRLGFRCILVWSVCTGLKPDEG
jgi:hypothetical protein